MSEDWKNHRAPTLELHAVHTARAYHFLQPGQLGGYAICTINDHTGELLIESDWGQWAHRWSINPAHLGHPTLTDFIRERAGVDYLHDKLHYGRKREEFSATKTVVEMRTDLLCGLDASRLWADPEIRDLWDRMGELMEIDDEREFVEHAHEVLPDWSEGRDVWEWLCTRETHSSWVLGEAILPALIQALRNERAGSAGRAVSP